MATKNKGGRPRKELKKEIFEKLCEMLCTQEEMCGFFGIDHKTLDAWCKREYGEGFSHTYKKFSQDGKISLRRAQFRMAEKSPAMAIWLGKQYLGQTDKVEAQIKPISDETRDSVNELINKLQPNEGTGLTDFDADSE